MPLAALLDALCLLLIESGADANKVDNYDTTPLHAASCMDHLTVAQLLIERGADVNKRADRSGWTPLHLACANKHLSVACLLIKRGADADVIDNNGTTPLHMVCQKGYTEFVKELAGSVMNSYNYN